MNDTDHFEIAIPSPIEAIDKKRRLFSRLKTELFSNYLEKKRTDDTSPRLLVLNGFGDLSHNLIMQEPSSKLATSSITHLMTRKGKALRRGGYFVKLNGKGVVVNPGKDFVDCFHRAGYHIWDIDHVIVTDKEEDACSDIETVWSLNKEVNTLLLDWKLEPHVIRYWLHPTAFESLSDLLRPTFRKEKGCITRLETFQEKEATEMAALEPSLLLSFLRVSEDLSSPLLCRLEDEAFSIGFLFHVPFHEKIASFFSKTPYMVVGVGNILFEEIAQIETSSSSLGYLGALEFIRTLPPETVIVLGEMGMIEGDTRIEILKQLSLDLEKKSGIRYSILPAEEGLTIHLKDQKVIAPGLEEQTPLKGLRVVRSSGLFSRLTFIDESSIY